MRVLFISNWSTERCGVRAFGEEWVDALRRQGVTVNRWDGTYTAVRALGYLSPTAGDYDIIHLNWDPQAINHYLPQHVAGLESKFSLFLHDVPPNSTCPVQKSARWVFAHEPGAGIQVLPHAVPPTPEDLPVPPTHPITIGVSGIRADPGFAQVQALCDREGWVLNAPYWWTGGGWVSNAEEIRRLAASTVNVCWYHTTGRGKSQAAMFCVAAGRPLVLSPSTMFSVLQPYDSEILIGEDLSNGSLEACIKAAITHPEIIPRQAKQDLAWDQVIQPVLSAWSAR